MNIINAAFVRNGVTVRTLPVYQYNRGMILQISGLDDLPATFRVDFSNTETGQSKSVIGTDNAVHIPYEYFAPGATIHCWLVWTGADYVVTRKHILIPVARRATPTDEEPTPEEQGVIDQAIAALNDAVTQTGQDVESAAGYAEQAEQSAQAAATAKNNAVAAQNAAEAAKDQVVEYASNAAASAQSASESAQSALQSKADAQAAAVSVAGAMDTLEATIQADLQAAKESGEFDGADGVSPTVTVTPIIDGHQVMITDAEGEHTFDVTDGEPGADGFSPVATVTQTQTGATISITDKAGTTTAQISNGAKGDPGDDYVLTAQDKAEIAQQAAQSIAPALDEKADAIHTAAGPAPIVSIPDAAAAPVDALTVGIEPVQDLHGYDHPWPAGGGENKINYLSCVGIGARDGTDSLYRNNTSISGTELTINQSYGENGGILKGVGTFSLATGEYVTISGKATLTGISALIVGISNYDGGGTNNINSNVTVTNGRFSVKLDAKSDYAKTGIFLQPQFAGSTAVVSDVMVALGQTEQPYSPYSNICPISGWTGANVTRTGKNLVYFPVETKAQSGVTWTCDGTSKIVSDGTATGGTSFSPSVSEKPLCAGTFTASFYTDITGNITYTLVKNGAWFRTIQSGGSYTFTVTASDVITGYVSCASGVNATGTSYIQLELGSTATAYEPYQGETYDVTFPSEAGTVYGGSLNVKTGVLSVDRAMVDLGTLNWVKGTTSSPTLGNYSYYYATPSPTKAGNANFVCSQYKTVNANRNALNNCEIGVYNTNTSGYVQIAIRDDAYAESTTSEFKTAMSGVQLVYEIATPVTYQLTPQQAIKTLLGQNNIWADTGDVTVGYKADTKLYIDKKFAELQALIIEH